jgi:hypothetical protein
MTHEQSPTSDADKLADEVRDLVAEFYADPTQHLSVKEYGAYADQDAHGRPIVTTQVEQELNRPRTRNEKIGSAESATVNPAFL